MGYCVSMSDCDFKIKQENIINAITAIGKYLDEGNNLRWISKGGFWDFFDNPAELFESMDYTLELDANKDYIITDFYGEKLGDEHIWMDLIAPYVEKGSWIKMYGEDGHNWTWIFDGEHMVEKSQEEIIAENAKKEAKKQEEIKIKDLLHRSRILARKELADEILSTLESMKINGNQIHSETALAYIVNNCRRILNEV